MKWRWYIQYGHRRQSGHHQLQMVTTDYAPVTSSMTYTISAAGISKLTRAQLSGTDIGITFSMDAK